jgi:hypothetical protein
MIGFKLMGGLGNMMFQIATAEYLSHKYNLEVCYTNVDEQFSYLVENYEWEKHAEEYFTIFKNVDWHKNQDKKHLLVQKEYIEFGYEELIPEDGTNYIGYFQSEKYFPDVEMIRKLFKFTLPVDTEEIVKLLSDNVTCSIHVRRGNYLDLSYRHTVLDMNYYNKAIRAMRSSGVHRFFIFSDDIEWCKENFKGPEFAFLQSKDYIEMWLMSICNNNIIANSSFSWWGAYLGNPENRLIIAPSQWFADNEEDGLDIVPDKWIKI